MRSFKKIISIFLSSLIISGSVLAAQASTKQTPKYVPELVTSKTGGVYGSSLSVPTPAPANEVSLPSYYSSRDEGYTTPVKYQGNKNICWAYATTSVFETLLNKNGDYTAPFSTSHIDSWAIPRSDGSGWQRNFQTDGAIVITPISYLVSWQGPRFVSEFSDDLAAIPYDKLALDELPEYGVTSIAILDGSTPETIKSYIMEYGAIWSSYSQHDEYMSKDYMSYYCNSLESPAGHAITVVGWDDNYSRENFTGSSGIPSRDGAWLIQNSWGETFHDKGFFWISYDDVSLFSNGFDTYAITDYQRIYSDTEIHQLETYGAFSHYIFSSIDELRCMNIFDFENDILDKVVFAYKNPGDSYEIFYVPLDENGVPKSDIISWLKLGEGVVDYSGYICADISDKKIPDGKAAIAINIKTDSDQINSVGVCTDINYSGSSPLLIVPKPETAVSYYSYSDGFSEVVTPLTDSQSTENNLVFSIKAITYSQSQTVEYDTGDVNMDGKINVKDVTAIQKQIVNLTDPTREQEMLADVDADGYVDGNDVIYLLKKIVGLL